MKMIYIFYLQDDDLKRVDKEAVLAGLKPLQMPNGWCTFLLYFCCSIRIFFSLKVIYLFL